jgi:sugar lactone lactonase YvrE
MTVVAGNGSEGFSGDGGPATSASLMGPWGVAVDPAGNLYIADTYSDRIRKVTGGTITTVAGNGNRGFSGDGGTATSASLNLPEGLAVDSAGNLYIADYQNNRIRKVSGGTITTVAGNGNQFYAGQPKQKLCAERSNT